MVCGDAQGRGRFGPAPRFAPTREPVAVPANPGRLARTWEVSDRRDARGARRTVPRAASKGRLVGAAAESRKPQPALEPGISRFELCCLGHAQLPEKPGGGHGQQALGIECAGLKPPNLDGYVKLRTTQRRGERNNTHKGVTGISLRNADHPNRAHLARTLSRGSLCGRSR